MKENETNQAAQVTSRRDFLKGAAVGGAALAYAGAVTTGAAADEATEEDVAQTTDAQQRRYAVHSTDVLIVGAGLTGMTAARVATKAGAKVTVIDKAKFAHCGNTGISWGMFAISSEFCGDESGVLPTSTFALDLLGVADQEYIMSNVQASMRNPMFAFIEQSGTVMERSRLGGGLWGTGGIEGREEQPFTMVTGGHWRHAAQALVRMGVEIIDRMMMVDIVTDESGRASGVVAIDLKTGNAHLFRAKSIIMATASFHWAHGQTIGGPDSTGEGHAIMMKHGLAMRDLELNLVDFEGSGPYGQTLDGPDQGWMEPTMGPGIGGPYYAYSLNKDGETFMEGFFTKPDLTFVENFVGVVLCSVREILQGKANDDNSLYADWSELFDGLSPLSTYDSAGEWAANVKRYFGEDSFDFTRVKAHYQSYGSAGMPKVNYESFETDIPGIFYAGATNGSFASLFCWGSGNVTGAGAAKAALDLSLPTYDAGDVQAILDKAYGKLEKEFTEDSIRPIEIMRKIQTQYARNLLVIKNEEGIQSAIDELLRIRDEDLPRMATPNKSMVLNRDWRNAIEVESMLTMSLAAAYAALERKDTRPMHFRTDYPTPDNENYLAHLWVTLGEDGSYSLEKTDINDAYISREDLIAQFPDLDISIPNPTVPTAE